MIRKTFSILLGMAVLLSTSCAEEPQPNKLTKKEAREGFILLFDGESTEGWRGYKKDHVPARWVAEGGCLQFNPEVEGDRGDIIYDQKFSDFHLKLEWKIAENGNSGIFYLGSEDAKWNAIYHTAPEMQVLDNAGHPDAKQGKDGNRKAGSLYDLIPAVPQNFKGSGEWNQAEVICKDKHVKHFQNGELVLEYTYGTPEWEALVADSKFPGLNPDWHKLQASGYIGVQDHNDRVWYRSIKLKEL